MTEPKLNTLIPNNELAKPVLNRIPKSALSSPHEVPKTSADNKGAFKGFLVIMLIKPPIASEPYSVEAGPFTTSTRSIKLLGIPDKP